jgi:hypothetical protein
MKDRARSEGGRCHKDGNQSENRKWLFQVSVHGFSPGRWDKPVGFIE